jgi:predicted nucleic acid-binding protein
MPSTYALDTNAIIYYVTAEDKARAVLVPIVQSYATLVVPAVVITELWSGKDTPESETRTIEEFLATTLIFSLDADLARSAGILRRNHNLSIGDSIIAATALSMGATLLTRNIRDFKKVPNLLLEAV